MIPVEQSELAPPLGNCFAACIASLLEIPLSQVPCPTAPRDDQSAGEAWGAYLQRLDTWMEGLGFWMFDLLPYQMDGDGERLPMHPKGYAIANAESPRFAGLLHCVVVKDGEIVWDPHPKREDGVGKVYCYTVLLPCNPAGLIPRGVLTLKNDTDLESLREDLQQALRNDRAPLLPSGTSPETEGKQLDWVRLRVEEFPGILAHGEGKEGECEPSP